jgi:GR25 family glycosyltransferase involved in LPS biosynthesis
VEAQVKYETHVIYVDFFPKSHENALQCINSLDSTWNAFLFSGCSPENLDYYEEKYKISKIQKSRKKINYKKIQSKKCCFYSHYALWNLCIEKDLKYITVLENDTEENAIFPRDQIEGFLERNKKVGIQLTAESMLTHLPKYRKYKIKYEESNRGINEIFYFHGFGKRFFAGATGYILDQEACRYLIDKVNNKGWYQNDLMFSIEDDFPLYFIKPSPVKYLPEKELKTSSFKT